jgi:predicted nucleic-acid-binding protein
MIAADSNLVVRHLTHDDARQTAIVEHIFQVAEARGEPIFLGHIVLCEVCWTLSSTYGFAKDAIVAALQGLLADGTFLVQGREIVERALAQYRKGGAGFPDYLIGQVAKQEGAAVTMTFDRKLSRAPGFELAKS